MPASWYGGRQAWAEAGGKVLPAARSAAEAPSDNASSLGFGSELGDAAAATPVRPEVEGDPAEARRLALTPNKEEEPSSSESSDADEVEGEGTQSPEARSEVTFWRHLASGWLHRGHESDVDRLGCSRLVSRNYEPVEGDTGPPRCLVCFRDPALLM